MNSAFQLTGLHAPAVEKPAPTERRRQRRPAGSRKERWLALALLVGGAWYISQQGWYSPRTEAGYWLGVAGGVAMLLLFAYPVRKRWPALAAFGRAKHWFNVHMVLGIVGPLLVLVHSTFQIGSVNAGVALFSMLVVAISGLVGRFIYLRTHSGLGGELETLDTLRRDMGLADAGVRSTLHFAPEAEARLLALERFVGRPGEIRNEHLRRLFVLPLLVRREQRLIRREVLTQLRALAGERGWDAKTLRSRERRARRVIEDYVRSVQRAAQLAAYARLFSLWHIAHVPFVFLMVLCALFHVVAVHAY